MVTISRKLGNVARNDDDEGIVENAMYRHTTN